MMKMTALKQIFLLGMLAMTGNAAMAQAQERQRELPPPLVIGHRGASALRPEHTLASYAKAIADGADFIEPDLVSTKDGVLIARHENEIGGTTDVAAHPEFAARKTRKLIDGNEVEGWFTEDFTLAEIKTLRARERIPQIRSTQYDGQFQVATFDEIIDFVAAESAARGRVIGLIPEIKHGTFFQQHALAMEDKVIATLDAYAYTKHAPVIIQSFEISNLKYLRQKLGVNHPNVALVQLLDEPNVQPGDVLAAHGKLTYADMLAPAGLKDIAQYAQYLGPYKEQIIPVVGDKLGTPTSLVHDAHAAGLKLIPYTFRPENNFLPKSAWQGSDPRSFNEAGSVAEIRAFLDAGIDGFFTDMPQVGRVAVDGWMTTQEGD